MNLLVDFKNNNQVLIIAIIAAIVVAIPAILTYYLFINFLKAKKPKYLSKLSFSLLNLNIFFSLVFSILSIVFIKLEIINTDTDSILVVVFLAISYLLIVLLYVILFFFSQYIWVLFDDNKLITLAEKINYEKITKIVDDVDSNKNVYLNFVEGTRRLRKIKFAKSTLIGSFFLENAKFSGVEPEQISQSEFINDLEVKNREAAYEKVKKSDKKKNDSVEETEITETELENSSEKNNENINDEPITENIEVVDENKKNK
ncbi:hypothetical protein STURO_v1c08760 [Spiroplasma turonicum]|nr:hypothetical protein STURO_v1c08760 [Spiroplasma turonicum]